MAESEMPQRALGDAPPLPADPPHDFANFDYLRLVAAAMVIFSHSFTVAQGHERNEPLVRLLGPDNILAIYGVCIFFVISGFLITMSAARSPTLLNYAAARILRIYPALIACQLLMALILGAIFSSVGPIAFVKGLEWARYAYWYSIDVAMSWDIPTVVFFDAPDGAGAGLNGSLWTIQQELFCYVVIGLLRAARLLRWYVVLGVFVLSFPSSLIPWSRNDVEVIMAAIDWRIEDARVYDYFWVGSSFFMGSLIHFLWAKFGRLRAWPMALCAIVLAYAVYRGRVYDLFPLYAAYPLLWFATSRRLALPSLKKFGDISYGVYLYGWPMQMLVRGLWGPGISWWMLFILSLLAACLCGYLSWHLLEKRMLRLKRFFGARPGETKSLADAAPEKAQTRAW